MRRLIGRIFLSCALAASPALLITSASYAQTITDPAKAGIDYEIQGEYAGRLQIGDLDETWGAQVIALGDGKFEVVGFKGGLPGDGWLRGDETNRGEGTVQGDFLYVDGENFELKIGKGKMEVIAEDRVVVTLEKVERKSPTLGLKPPQGAKVLFDGSNVDQWVNGKLVDAKYLGATNVSSKLALKDHTLHIEFRTPFMPKDRGQARGNSGVYIQGRYELQVLDSFGLDGADNECGGIYSIKKPKVNMCFPPLAWQTYDIEFKAARYENDKKVTNARVTIKHNGVVIHDNLELTHGTPGNKPEGPSPEALFLQDHGNPVVFQNVWVVTND
ncbi:MAG: DUF1080 domain-containing protein [Pirellula sp.]|jgi:hypothetical protein